MSDLPLLRPESRQRTMDDELTAANSLTRTIFSLPSQLQIEAGIRLESGFKGCQNPINGGSHCVQHWIEVDLKDVSR